MKTIHDTIIELQNKTVHNVTVALFDFEFFSSLTQNEIDEYLSPDSARKENILKKCAKEIEENTRHLEYLKIMQSKYEHTEPNQDLAVPIRQACAELERERLELESAEATEPEPNIHLDTPDGGTEDGSPEDGGSGGGHRTGDAPRGGAGEDDGRN